MTQGVSRDMLAAQRQVLGLSEGREGAAYIRGMGITPTTTLESLDDDALLERVRVLAKDARRVEADLIAHLAEVDARGLLARHVPSSLFGYCTLCGAQHNRHYVADALMLRPRFETFPVRDTPPRDVT